MRWLTLALRCLILGLLAAAFARPFWQDARTTHGRVMVIAMDNSMSMQAGERWSQGRAWALDQLGELHPGDQAGVLLMHPNPSWLVPVTENLSAVGSALIDAKPGFEKTHYSEALRMAAKALEAHPAESKTLIWVADEQRLGWMGADLKKPLPNGIQLRFSPMPRESTSQAAITAVEKSSAAGRDELRVTVKLFEPEEQSRRLTISSGKQLIATQKISLQKGENRIVVPLPKSPVDGWHVALDDDDLAADNTFWLARADPHASPVLLDSTSGTDFLEHALNSTKRLGAGAMAPGKLPAAEWPAGAVVILRGSDAFRDPARLNHFADAGGALWIFLDGSPEQTAWLKARGIQVTARPETEIPGHLQDWDPEHPILTAFAGDSLVPLLEVEFKRGFNLSGDALSAVANWSDGVMALASCNDHGRRIFLAGFSLDRESTNWTTQPSFVPFVHQTVRWLGSFGGTRADWRVGSSIPIAGEGTWTAIDGPVSQPPRPVNGSVRAEVPGLYEFVSGSTRRVFAVNVPAEESDLAPWPNIGQLASMQSTEPAKPQSTQSTVLPVSSEIAENQQRLWWWLLALCGAALLAELALANRTSM